MVASLTESVPQGLICAQSLHRPQEFSVIAEHQSPAAARYELGEGTKVTGDDRGASRVRFDDDEREDLKGNRRNQERDGTRIKTTKLRRRESSQKVDPSTARRQLSGFPSVVAVSRDDQVSRALVSEQGDHRLESLQFLETANEQEKGRAGSLISSWPDTEVGCSVLSHKKFGMCTRGISRPSARCRWSVNSLGAMNAST